MTLYTTTALSLTVAYGILSLWAAVVARRLGAGRDGDGSSPILAIVSFVCAVWAVWYGYLLVVQPPTGGVVQLLNRTVHIPTLVLFTIVCAWRGRKP